MADLQRREGEMADFQRRAPLEIRHLAFDAQGEMADLQRREGEMADLQSAGGTFHALKATAENTARGQGGRTANAAHSVGGSPPAAFLHS